MRIIVFGGGALGSLISALLSKENEVYMVGRGEHVREVSEKGLIVEGIDEGKYSVLAGSSLEDSPFYPNWIILTVKAYDTEKASEYIKRIFPNVPVLSFQNGLDNETVLMRNGIDAVGGVTSHGITFLEAGRILHAGSGRTVIGEMDGRNSMRVRAMAYVLSSAGIETEISENISGEIWLKGSVNAVINPLTAILGIRNGFLLENEDLEGFADLIAEECSHIAEISGISLPDDPKKQWRMVAEKTSENMSSSLQDIRRGKRTEINEINGAFVRKAEASREKAPYNHSMLALVKARERFQ